MITRLTIQHYRSIEDLDLRLGPVNVLVGRNGAGKSNIVDAIRFVRDALRHGLDHAVTQRHGIANIRQWSAGRPYNITISIEAERVLPDGVAKDTVIFCFSLASTRDGFRIQKEKCQAVINLPFRDVEYGEIEHRKFSVNFERGSSGLVVYDDMDGRKRINISDSGDFFFRSRHFVFGRMLNSVFSDFEAYSVFPNTLRQPQKQSTDTVLDPHGGNLASVLKRMIRDKKTDAFNEIVSAMRSVIPDLESIPVQSTGPFIVPRFKIRSPSTGKAHFFDVDQVSDGSLRVLGLLVALYQDPRPATIALEEPEQTVHPGALQIIADSIAEVSESTQVLVTTHSPDFLDRIDPSQVIAVDYIDEKTVARPLAQSQVDAVRNNLFSLGELMSIEGLHG